MKKKTKYLIIRDICRKVSDTSKDLFRERTDKFVEYGEKYDRLYKEYLKNKDKYRIPGVNYQGEWISRDKAKVGYLDKYEMYPITDYKYRKYKKIIQEYKDLRDNES